MDARGGISTLICATLSFARAQHDVADASVGCSQKAPSIFNFGTVTDSLLLRVDDPLNFDGFRSYNLFVPSTYAHDRPVPLVFDFHGFYDDSLGESKEDGLASVAEKEGFIVAYPRGMADTENGSQDMLYSWNGGGTNGTHGAFGPTCGKDHDKYPCYRSCEKANLCVKDPVVNQQFCDSSTCTDDVSFIHTLFDYLTNVFCIDRSRVHATAMSNGAIFLYYLATTSFGTYLASIVPVAGSLMLGHSAVPSVPMPVVDIHGVQDETVPANVSNSWGAYKNNGCPVPSAGRMGCTVSEDVFFYTPVDTLLSGWAQVNGCHGFPFPVSTSRRFDGITGFSCMAPYGVCKHRVLRCVHDAGHTWPFHVGDANRRPSSRFGELFWWFAADLRRDVRPSASWRHATLAPHDSGRVDVVRMSILKSFPLVFAGVFGVCLYCIARSIDCGLSRSPAWLLDTISKSFWMERLSRDTELDDVLGAAPAGAYGATARQLH